MKYIKHKVIKYGIILILVILAFIIGFVCLFMLLYNSIVPLFWANTPILNFWQAFGIICLLSIIGSLIFKK